MMPERYNIYRRMQQPSVCLRGLSLFCSIALAAEVSAAAMPAAVSPPVAGSIKSNPYAQPVAEASQRFGILEHWIWAVMRAESGGRSRAVSHAGAMGLMQIMPRTWTTLSARFGLGPDPFDVRANILGGAAYLRMMWDRYGDIALMLAAYNAGPGRVDDYRMGRRRLPVETRNYVARIAPSLGTGAAARFASGPPVAVQSWRHAPVFASRHRSASLTDEAAVEAQPTPTDAWLPDALPLQLKANSDRLFVPLAPRKP